MKKKLVPFMIGSAIALTSVSYANMMQMSPMQGGMQGGEMPNMQGGEMPNMQGGEMPNMQGGEMPQQINEVMAVTEVVDMPSIATATPSNTNLTVNGTMVSVEAYMISENNFVKLRDLANMVNGTEKNFDVVWNAEYGVIELFSNTPYSSATTTTTVTTSTESKTANLTTSPIYLNGKELSLVAYQIEDSNYFKLRDIMALFDIYVGWDADTSTATIDTSKSYEGTTTTTPLPEGMMGERPEGMEGMMPEGMMGQGGPPSGGMSGGMGAMESTLTVAEAKAIEEELVASVGYTAVKGGYPIVDTNQTVFYSNDAIIDAPNVGDAFYGQDASYSGNLPSYTNNNDGTITDNVTGLMWQQDPGAKMTWGEAVENLEAFNEVALGGYSDWRIPTMKELFSLVDFSGNTGMSSSTSTPYIDTDYFVFTYGDQAGEARFIDSQILTSTIYGSTTLGNNTTVFGFNFADGRIKGYEIDKDFYCYYVRGNTNYGENLYIENGDNTITDEATSLMWTQYDSGYYNAGDANDGTMSWEEALAWVQEMNDENFLGYSDWRLPNVKELHSLLDYSNSPAVTGKPAIDEVFYCTEIINYFDEKDWGFYWSGTTHDDLSASSIRYGAASYVVFGNSLGEMNGVTVDAHGSGAQRSDPKTGDREEYPAPDPNAPQGDEQRVFNMVRLVRDAK